MAIRKIPSETNSFHFYNANPKDRKTGDCVIRALCTAMNKSWDEVFEGLTLIALKYKVMVDCPECYEKYLKQEGWIKLNQPRKVDNTKYTGVEYCEKLNRSWKNGYKDSTSVIAHIGGHHIVCIKWDSLKGFRVNDIWNSTNGCIGKCWVKQEVE